MLTLSQILNAQNGFKPVGSEENQTGTASNILGGIQNGLQLSEILKNAGIFGGAGAAGATGAAAVPPVV